MCVQYWAPSDKEKKIFRKYAWSEAKDEEVLMTLPTPVVAMGYMGGQELTSKTCRTFRPGGWYTDDVMNSYGDLVKKRLANRSQDGPIVAIYGTYFMDKLLNAVRDSATGRYIASEGYEYEKVRGYGKQLQLIRPTPEVEIADRLLVLANKDNNHWVLLLADLQRKQLVYFDPLGGRDRKGYLKALGRYIGDEIKAKLGVAADTSRWAYLYPEPGVVIPEQRNSCDCGVFALAMLLCLVTDKPFDINQEQAKVNARMRFAYELCKGTVRPVNEHSK